MNAIVVYGSVYGNTLQDSEGPLEEGERAHAWGAELARAHNGEPVSR